MVPRRLRLSRASFPQNRAGSRASTTSFSLVWGPSSQGGCAAVVGKAVAKKAVERNLIQRRIYASMRPWCSPNRYLVVYARAGAKNLSFKALTEELSGLLSESLS